MSESAKEVLTNSLKKEDAIQGAIGAFSEAIKKAMEEREWWREGELRRAQTIITRQKQELDIAVRELVKIRQIIAGMKELLKIKE